MPEMAIEQKYIDLINADVDGEISPDDKRELDAFLAANDEARELHAELTMLCGSIDSVESASPPPHLKYVILSAVLIAVAAYLYLPDNFIFQLMRLKHDQTMIAIAHPGP